ncbi:MAG: damage-inducible protein CinA [Cytophagaceae bacterium]|nr:damage-inducible protein CinA [Cytophagaceae bacterium]
MQAHVITIGDEILIGQIFDTNSTFIAKELDRIGFQVTRSISIPDTREAILENLAYAKKNADVVLMTGGLGPTKDDVTKQAFCDFFDDTLVRDDEVLENITRIFSKHLNRPLLPSNVSQAQVPSKCTVLMNRYGTAPGMWMQEEKTVFVSMPGVPFEMKELMKDEVLPRLMKTFERPYILHKTLQTYGVGESELADRIEDWENALPPQIKLAYLPSLGKVRLRLSTVGSSREEVEQALEAQVKTLHDILQDVIVGYDEEDTLAAAIHKKLTDAHKTLALAESFTGGKLADTFVTMPGASRYFKGSLVAYAKETKINLLDIDNALIEQHSVVSAEVASAMALAAQKKFAADYTIATTGNAGPSKGDSDAEVGTVFMAIATPDGVEAHRFSMGQPREKVVGKAINKALQLLNKELLKI